PAGPLRMRRLPPTRWWPRATADRRPAPRPSRPGFVGAGGKHRHHAPPDIHAAVARPRRRAASAFHARLEREPVPHVRQADDVRRQPLRPACILAVAIDAATAFPGAAREEVEAAPRDLPRGTMQRFLVEADQPHAAILQAEGE